MSFHGQVGIWTLFSRDLIHHAVHYTTPGMQLNIKKTKTTTTEALHNSNSEEIETAKVKYFYTLVQSSVQTEAIAKKLEDGNFCNEGILINNQV